MSKSTADAPNVELWDLDRFTDELLRNYEMASVQIRDIRCDDPFWRTMDEEWLRFKVTDDRCPYCDSRKIGRYCYGMVTYDAAMEIKERGDIMAGCCVSDMDPHHHCWDCDYDW